MTELWHLGVEALSSLFAAGQTSPTEALQAHLERIREKDPAIGAFSCVLEESAVSEARARTEDLQRGLRRGPLHGVPVAVKELFDVNGAPADYGSDTLAGRVADADAELVRRLRRGGAVIVGTTRSHEFGWGITTQHQRRGGTRNPWDLTRIPGGSSGGSGAAIAAGMVPAAVGSDTGGSIRIPSSFCGVSGLKPGFGRIPRTGGVALAPTLDTPGAMGRSIRDAEVLVNVMSGSDGVDPDCTGGPCPTAAATPSTLAGARLGISENLFEVELDSAVAPVYASALEALTELGAEIVEVSLPDAAEVRACFETIQKAEVYYVHSHMLGLYPSRADDYGSDVRSRVEAAEQVTTSEFVAALLEKPRITAEFTRQLLQLDALISPISAVPPSLIQSSDKAVVNGRERVLREVVMGFTVPMNLTGLPTAVVPAGFDSHGLPAAIQFTPGSGREDAAVALASAFELASVSVPIAPV